MILQAQVELIPNYAPEGDRPRFSRLAVAGIILAPLPAIATLVLALVVINFRSSSAQGWEAFGQLLGIGFAASLILICGTLCAALAISMGAGALWRISRQSCAFRGRRTAWAALIIGSTWLLLMWGSIATFTAIASNRRAPHRATEVEVQKAFSAVKEFAMRSGRFPQRLEDVTTPELGARFVYLGRGLPATYADYRTPGSGAIVVMYAKKDVAGVFTAICANGMMHEWTKPVLEDALRQSNMERDMRGLPHE